VFLGQVCAPVSRLGSCVACVNSPGISGGSVAETSLRIAFSWLLPLVVVFLLFIVIIKGLSFVLAGGGLSLSRSYAMFILALSRFAFAGKVRSAGRRSIFAAWWAEIHNHSRPTFNLILDWLLLSLLVVVVCRRCLPSMTAFASNSSRFLPDGALLLLRVKHLGFVDVFRHHVGLLLIPHVSCHGVTTLHHFVSLAASLNLSASRSISIRHGHVRFARVRRSQSRRLLLLKGKTALLLYSVSICGRGSL